MKNNKIGIGVVIFGIAAMIAAIGGVVMNLLTLKWTAKVFEPFDRLFRKSEPLLDKYIDYGEKSLDNLMES